MENKRDIYRKNLRNALDNTQFLSFEPLKKMAFILDMNNLVIAQKMIIDEAKLSPEKLEAANLRLDMLIGSVNFLTKIYDEGSAAINLCSHLSIINLHLEADNRELK